MLTEEQIKQYKDFGAQLESIYADDAVQLEAVKYAMQAFDALCENGGTAATMDVDIGGATKNQTGSDLHTPGQLRPGYEKAGNTSVREEVEPVSEQELVTLQKTMLRWGMDKPVECYKWIKNELEPKLRSNYYKSKSHEAGIADKNVSQMFDDEVSGKADDEAAKQQAAEAKQQEQKNNYAQKAAEIDKKEADLKESNKAYGDNDQKLSKWDQLKRWYYKKRAGLKEAVERGDMAMVEAIEAELKACQELLESVGFDMDVLID